jgi:hypothetical protein
MFATYLKTFTTEAMTFNLKPTKSERALRALLITAAFIAVVAFFTLLAFVILTDLKLI